MGISMNRRPGKSKLDKTLFTLRENIVSGVWPVNAKIPKETELVELLGVSKSTIREAVNSLTFIGMLEPIKGVGTFVRAMSPVNGMMDKHFVSYPVEQILIARRAIEIEAAQQAAVNRSEEQLQALKKSYEYDMAADPNTPRTPSRGEFPGSFHHLVFEAAGSPLMSSLFTAIMNALRDASKNGELLQGSQHDLRHLDHGALLDAIEQQDVAKAAHVMALHVDRDLIPLAGLEDPMNAICEALDVEAPTGRARILSDAGFIPRV